MEADKKNEYMKAKEQVQKFFEAVKVGKLEDIKKAIEAFAHQQKDENDNEEHSIRIKNLINDTKEGKGRTIMHFACSRGDIEIVKYLISLGADPNSTEEDGNNALFVAVQHQHYDLAKYLIDEQKMDVNTQRPGGATIFHIICSKGNVEFADYLLSKGANLEGASNYGSPLEWALSSQKKKIAIILLDKGANPNGQPYPEKIIPPPLILSISFQDPEIVDILLAKGADINQKDPDGYDALQVAAELGDLKTCKILIEKGANPNYVCKNKTALDLAYENEKWEVVSYLRPLTSKSIEQDSKSDQEKPKDPEEEDLANIPEEECNPQEAERLKNEGNEFFQKQQFEESLKKYREALKYNRKLIALYTNIGLCLIKLGKPQVCLKYCKKAKELDPKWSKAYIREAQAYSAMKEYGESAASYWEALQLEPSNSDLRDLFHQTVKIGKEEYQKKQS